MQFSNLEFTIRSFTVHHSMSSCAKLLTLSVLSGQGLHMLEKYLNIQDCLGKSLKIKFALKSTGKTLKGLEKSLNCTIYRSI